MSFAKKIAVTYCARAVYTARVPVHGTYTAVYTVRHGSYAAVYTARSRPCTQPCIHAYVYTAVTRPCTRHIHGRVHGQYTTTHSYTRAMYTARTRLCKCSCTRAVYLAAYTAVVDMAGRPTGPCTRSQSARYGRVRPVTAVCTRPVHSQFTAVHTAVYDGSYTAVRHVHTSTPQLKVRVRAMYTSVYTAGTQ